MEKKIKNFRRISLKIFKYSNKKTSRLKKGLLNLAVTKIRYR